MKNERETADSLLALALPQDFTELARTTTRPTDIPVRKPSKKQFFRVHPDTAWSGKFALFKDEESGDAMYLVAGLVYEADPDFAENCDAVLLFYCQYRSGTPFLWPAKLPTGGQGDTWHESALAIAAEARERWVKMTSDRTASCYVKTVPDAVFADPEWPGNYSFADALRWGFKDRVITDPEHAVIRRAKGLE